ncbi:MAG: FAD:protein FMN transferase [Elusimicrobia bacterium]|nr:FAD:protein FMN transferase [Elusimicrobiota bacterium]
MKCKVKILAGFLFSFIFLGFFISCNNKASDKGHVYTEFMLGVHSRITVFGADEKEAEYIAETIFAEWDRISKDFSFSEPYSYISDINKYAYLKSVKINEELYELLRQSVNYYNLTDGAFDITFAPLWPIWKEAAASKKLPADEDIKKAVFNIGLNHVEVNPYDRTVKFNKPVHINVGGILRAHCLKQGYKILKRIKGDYSVELKLGGYVLTKGKHKWEYPVYDPFKNERIIGKICFEDGVVVSSSGRDHFVQIEGKLYSHILDIKTGYPLEDFSNLIVYFENIENDDFIPSVVLSLMGKSRAFETLAQAKGSIGVWIDGKGQVYAFENKDSRAKWIESKKFLFF